MNGTTIKISLAAVGMIALIGCGGGSDSDTPTTTPVTTGGTSDSTTPATSVGTRSYLFYGNADHKQLGSLRNFNIVDPNNPNDVILSNDTLDVRYPVLSTAIGEYNATTHAYKNLYICKLSYVSDGVPYIIDMTQNQASGAPVSSATHEDDETGCDCAPALRAATPPHKMMNSKASGLTAAGRRLEYEDRFYMGTKQILIAKNAEGKQVLIRPTMEQNDAPLDFENKTFLTLSYPSYGDKATGMIIYDTKTQKVQNCTMDLATCTDIMDAGSEPKFLGDIGGTTLSALSISDHYYRIDKADNSYKALNIPTTRAATRASASRAYFNGDSIYILEEGNMSRLNVVDESYIQIASNGLASRIRAFTSDMVIFGDDSQMYAASKDGSSNGNEIEISTTTKLKGQKYPFDMGIGDTYFFNLYRVDEDAGTTAFRACQLKGGDITCKNDSFWGPVVAAKEGVMHFDSTYPYTPQAYIRIDDTDNYGGGKVTVVDPTDPLGSGLVVGEVATYNFQTFVNGRYTNELIDSDGTIIVYAKNDLNYRSDAFMLNLRKANSLKNISNEPDPAYEEINGGRSHCHGRYCSVCHSFSGGRINADRAGKSAAVGYTIRYDFDNGESLLANIRKGVGENFNTPLQNLVGKNFTANVVDANGTVVNRSNEFSHRGAEYYNCNFCHQKDDLRHDAPSVISIEASE